MTYGRTTMQELRLEGRRLLNRHYYGDGRWGWRNRTPREEQTYRGWRVVKQRPKRTAWAKSSGPLSRKVHAVRYSLTAEHVRTGEIVYLTVWLCGQHSQTKPRPESHPAIVCAACLERLSGRSETVLADYDNPDTP